MDGVQCRFASRIQQKDRLTYYSTNQPRYQILRYGNNSMLARKYYYRTLSFSLAIQTSVAVFIRFSTAQYSAIHSLTTNFFYRYGLPRYAEKKIHFHYS